MTVGLSTTLLANKWLDMLGGTAFTAPAGAFAELHLGDPGANGTSNPSTETSRKSITYSAASGGSKAMSNTPSWSWVQGTETISHLAIWDASTSGNFLFSITLTASKQVANGDTLNITSLSISFTPLAA
jgi:hypothetical protein